MARSERMKLAIAELGLEPLEQRLHGAGAYLVGGAARALASGGVPGGDVDIAVETDLESVLTGIEPDRGTRRHDRFETATVALEGGRHADLARTRTESYPAPGALPVVEPASIGQDLARRDFTVNAIAIALDAPHDVLDPFSGVADLGSRTLRVLHPDSFRDDPTRAIRAARYCARLGLEPDAQTLGLLTNADLGTVSDDRRRAELARLASETAAPDGFRLLARWGVSDIAPRALDLIAAVDSAVSGVPALWSSDSRRAAILTAAGGGEDLKLAQTLAAAAPDRPSTAVALAAPAPEHVLLVALAAGAGWVEPYMREWRHVRLEIGGDDLIAAGHRPGPAIGAGLKGALALKLDGELPGGREQELAAALRIAAEPI
jgi:tRNA nucleotidyltransferase (CCA-adding enzyme)